MKIKNIGKRTHTIFGRIINPQQEIDIDVKKEELERFPFLEIMEEKKKSKKIKIETEKIMED